MALIAHWPLDGRLDDISGNGYKLENINCEIMSDGPFGKCYNVTGSNEIKVKTPGNIVEVLNSNKFSISIRFKIKNKYNVNVEGFLTSGTTHTANRMLHIGLRGNKLTFAFYSDDLNSEIDIETGVWYHAVFILNDGIQYIYINGSLDSSRVIKSRLNIQELVFRFGRYASHSTNANISNCRIYDHALSDYEIIKDMNEPILELDFKGSIPPTVNWLDSVDKIFKYNITGDSSGSVLTPNHTYMYKKHPSINAGFYFKPTYKDFTLSFKVKVISGLLSKIGGHGKHNGAFLTTQVKLIRINNMDIESIDWCGGVNLNDPITIGDFVDVKVHFSFNEAPIWDTHGLCIQPNRQCNSEEFDIECEIFDIQIEEGLEATPFCTWSRDELYIPDKSNFKNSYKDRMTDNKLLPIHINNKIESSCIGSKCSLLFKDSKESFILKGRFLSRNNTVSMVAYMNTVESGEIWLLHQYIANNTSRFVLGIKDNFFWILLGNLNATVNITTNIRVQNNTAYYLSVVIDEDTIIIYVNGVVAGSFADYKTNPTTLVEGLYLGNSILTTSYYKADFHISDLKIIPTVLTAEDIKKEYTRLKNRVLTFESAFENIPTLNTKVPKLWESNPNTIGVKCFSENPSIPKDQPIPIGWGGEFKQPSNSILSYSIINNTIIHTIEEVMNIDSNLNPTRSLILTLEDNQNNEDLKLTVIDRFKN